MTDKLKSTQVCYDENVLMMRIDDCVVFGNKEALQRLVAKIGQKTGKWHINFDPYDESTSPKEAGYYRIIEEDGNERTDYYFGEPRVTGHGIGYWADSEKTIVAWARLEWK